MASEEGVTPSNSIINQPSNNTHTKMHPTQLIKDAGVTPDPSKDQHFLINPDDLQRVIETAPSGETALEIGGGIGNLTKLLEKRYEEVITIEKDPDLADYLRTTHPDIEVIHGDALEIDIEEIQFDVCVSNPPYSISTPLIFKLLPLKKPVHLTLQKELVDRITAQPGTKEYGRLTVTTNHYAEPETGGVISRHSFEPPPEIQTAILTLTPREPSYEVHDIGFFMDLTRGVFTQRRKTIRNAIKNTAHITGITNPGEAVETLPEDLLQRRPDTLKPEEIAYITETLADES